MGQGTSTPSAPFSYRDLSGRYIADTSNRDELTVALGNAVTDYKLLESAPVTQFVGDSLVAQTTEQTATLFGIRQEIQRLATRLRQLGVRNVSKQLGDVGGIQLLDFEEVPETSTRRSRPTRSANAVIADMLSESQDALEKELLPSSSSSRRKRKSTVRRQAPARRQTPVRSSSRKKGSKGTKGIPLTSSRRQKGNSSRR